MTIRPKFRILINVVFFSERQFDQNLGLPLIYFFHLQTTIRQKYKIFHLFFLRYSLIYFFYSLIYSFINCADILFALSLAVLPLHFVHYIQSSTSYPYISYTIFMEVLLLYISYAVYMAI